MAFKRTYSAPTAEDDLYVTVLVECENCGSKDVLESVDNIEYVDGRFHNATSIDAHEECPLCGTEDAWIERAEHISIGIPAELRGDAYLINTIDSMVDSTHEFLSKLEVAQDKDFRVKEVLEEEGTVILWKE